MMSLARLLPLFLLAAQAAVAQNIWGAVRHRQSM
jgi:hypothetical protein